MFPIGYRTLKTAIGAAISVGISEALQLHFYSAAPILTILSISVTRKGSLRLSWQRLIACLVGLFLSAIFFELIGYFSITLGLILLVYIPLAVRLKIKDGIVQGVIIILHLYTLKTVSFAVIWNEFLLIVIGIGVGLIMNLYMPSRDKEIAELQAKIEKNFQTILREYAEYLRNPQRTWDGKELTETGELLTKAKGLALIRLDNQLKRNEDESYRYFRMREKQFDILMRILPYVSALDEPVSQGYKLAEFLQSLSEAVGPQNTTHVFLKKLDEMEEHFKKSELPKTRKEFEIRASLFYIMRELERYLLTKEAYYNYREA